MNERMSTKHRQHAHVLLRMVQLMEAPEHPHAVVGQMDEPIQTVHCHDDDGDHTPTGNRADPRQDDPRQTGPDHLREGECQGGHEWRDEGCIHHRIEKVLTVAAGKEGPRLCRPQPLHDEEDPDDARVDRSPRTT